MSTATDSRADTAVPVRLPGRQLRVELRRSTALPAALAGAALLGVLLFLRSDEWADGWTGLSLTFRNDLTVLLPLALAAGAWQGGRERRAGTEDLVASTPRPPRQRAFLPGAAVALGLLAALCLTLLVVAVAGGRGLWLGQSWPAAVVGVGLLALAAAVALGVALGRAVRSNLVAPLALVVSFLPLLTFPAGSYVDSWPRLLTGGLEPAGGDTSQVRTAATVGQAVWFAALLAVGVLAGAGRTRTRALAVAPLLFGLLVAVPLLRADGGTAYTVDPTASRQVCAAGQPRVCVAAVHRAALGAVTGPARQVLAALQRFPDPPTRAVEQTGVRRPGGPALSPDVLPLTFPRLSSGEAPYDAAGLARELADGFGVRPCAESPAGPRAAYVARQVAAAWLVDAPVDPGGPPQAADVLQHLRALPPAEQQSRMTNVREALRSCQRNPLEPLA